MIDLITFEICRFLLLKSHLNYFDHDAFDQKFLVYKKNYKVNTKGS